MKNKELLYSISAFVIATIFLIAIVFNSNDCQYEITFKQTVNVLNSAETDSYEKEAEVLFEDMSKINCNDKKLKKEEKTIIHDSGHIGKNKCELPAISTHVKFFTDYRCYNLWYTPHYRLQQSAWTDEQGLRRFKDDYIVALGSFYSIEIGDRFEITLASGKIFTVILGDGKSDEDCDSKNMYTPCIDYEGNTVANLLEFIIDEKALSSEVYG